MEGAYMEPDMNYKFTAILIIAICLLAVFGRLRIDTEKLKDSVRANIGKLNGDH
jgi:hypothetical protein